MPGLTNYLRNKIVDWMHRGVAFTPPTSMFLRLCSTEPNPAAAGTEVAGTDYSPQEIDSDTTSWAATNAPGSTAGTSTGTNGNTSNNATVDFGIAGAGGWTTASHWELWDAASGGNRLFYGVIVDGDGVPTPRSISEDDPVSFPPGSLLVIWA